MQPKLRLADGEEVLSAIKALGAKPIVELERIGVRAEKVAHKNLFALVSRGEQSERFLLEPDALDKVVAVLTGA